MKRYFKKYNLRVLFTSPAYNRHILNIAFALQKAGMLGGFCTTFSDNYSTKPAKWLRERIGKLVPFLDKVVRKRRIDVMPSEKIYKDPIMFAMRILANRLHLNKIVCDFFWEKEEHHLDKKSSDLIKKKEFNFFLGIEHGCLYSLQAAKRQGKKTAVRFLSPHHSFFEKWVMPEYKKYPELLDSQTEKLLKLSLIRDQRRDKEADMADIILTNSELTTNSFIDAGYDRKKILTVPLGAPEPISEVNMADPTFKPFRFIYAGSFSVRKGAHYLLMAWNEMEKTNAQLHVYGENQLTKRFTCGKENNIFFHSRIVQKMLLYEFKKANILVFPTLCDGFAMVIFEAMACGLPAITTKNAGAAQFIEDGKNGFLVPPADPESLKERMLWCVDNPHKVYKMRKEALITAQSRTWKDFQKDFIEKLKENSLDAV